MGHFFSGRNLFKAGLVTKMKQNFSSDILELKGSLFLFHLQVDLC